MHSPQNQSKSFLISDVPYRHYDDERNAICIDRNPILDDELLYLGPAFLESQRKHRLRCRIDHWPDLRLCLR